MPVGTYSRFIKRGIDFGVAAFFLVLFSPLLLIVAVAIKLTSPGPILFIQERIGMKGVVFKVLKFRTMTNKIRRTVEEVLPDNAEVTAVGRVLRRYKLDELPQLINVLIGQMSIVGPRPMGVEWLGRLDETGEIRLRVRPGLTGLAQVNGNIYLSWPERFLYDAAYVHRISFVRDILIVRKTFSILIKGEQSALRKPTQGVEINDI